MGRPPTAAEPRLPDVQQLARLFLPVEILQQMHAEANNSVPNETGGVLLGAMTDSAVWVEAVIGPGPNAVHRRASFIPDGDDQQRKIAAAYQSSGRRIAYLGDWHTHPVGGAYLSRTDVRTLRSIARHDEARQANPVMVVLAGGEPWDVRAWHLLDRSWCSPMSRIVAVTIEIT